jgi:hypothetical protein
MIILVVFLWCFGFEISYSTFIYGFASDFPIDYD